MCPPSSIPFNELNHQEAIILISVGIVLFNMVLGFADDFISSYARKSPNEENETVLSVEERLPYAFSSAKTIDPAVLRRAQSLSLSAPQAHRKSSMPLLSGSKFSGTRARNTKLNCQRLSEVQNDAKKDARTQSSDEKIRSRVIPGHQVSWSNAKFKKGVTSREREEAIKAEKKAIEAAQKEHSNDSLDFASLATKEEKPRELKKN